jgi:hypothetical protein
MNVFKSSNRGELLSAMMQSDGRMIIACPDFDALISNSFSPGPALSSSTRGVFQPFHLCALLKV